MSLRLPPEEYSVLQQLVLTRDNFRCRHCRYRQVEVHHIVFRSKGGEDTTHNLVSLCTACHAGLHSGKLSICSGDLGANGELQFTAVEGWRPQ